MPARRVAFLAPMPLELRPLVKRLHLRPVDGRAPVTHAGAADAVEVVAGRTGIGTVGATETARRLLEREAVDHVAVVGVAGGIPGRAALGDLVVPERVVDDASGRSLTPTPPPGVPPSGTIVTTDVLYTDPGALAAHAARGVTALDMESAAVGAVCEERGVAWSVFRGISDMAGDPVIDESVLHLARPDGSADLRAVLRYVARHPGRIPYLVRLARQSTRAADLAARAAIRSLAASPAPS